MSDDHSTAAISAYSSKLLKTPNIDRIASGGILFENVFVTSSLCALSKAAIMSGKHAKNLVLSELLMLGGPKKQKADC